MKSRAERVSGSEKAFPVKDQPSSSIPQESEVEYNDNSSTIRIVGIGASAGGLEALEVFFRSIKDAPGIAFVIVQHMDPTQKGILAEILQRSTFLNVVQITDRMRVEPNYIYVIPPNKDLSILHGVLHLSPPVASRGFRLPIDFFFRSLADDLRELSIGVILTGMGSDGTLGIKAIKENAGAVFVQDPETAKFNGMPMSAIETGLADIIAPVDELPKKILDYTHHFSNFSGMLPQREIRDSNGLEKIFILLRARSKHDFSQYKKSTIYRRVERRMSLHHIEKLSSYIGFLQENPEEIDLLFRELLIGVTSFFRDTAAWEQLQQEVLPALITANPKGKSFRVWIPGCSTGEEAYSLAIVFLELLAREKPDPVYSMQIFATDLSADGINKARQGFFPLNIVADITPERLQKYFIQEETGYRIRKEIRDMIVFATQDVIMDPPFTRLDLIICRNLMIYLSADLQKKLVPLFFYCLVPDSFLFLGTAETVGNYSDLFIPLEGRNRIYHRLPQNVKITQIDFPASAYYSNKNDKDIAMPLSNTPQGNNNIHAIMDQLLLTKFTPAAVLVNVDGDILFVSGHTGKFLELPVGKVSWNIFAMVHDTLRYELASAFQKAVRQKETVTCPDLVISSSGSDTNFDLIIQPQGEMDDLNGAVLIVFNENRKVSSSLPAKTGKAIAGSKRVEKLEHDLQIAKDELRSTREMMLTSQEELKASNEELHSTNEELQSTNEELTTSKEEMQSMNEELQTVNNELQSKLDDLSRANNDMKNLLNSTDIATLFLDEKLKIRRFTDQATKIIKLIPGDTGRPITDISSVLIYPELVGDVREVLRTLIFVEKNVPSQDGRWFTVRIMPYRTIENRIDGVVITFMEITKSKLLESELIESERGIKEIINHMANAFVLLRSIYNGEGIHTQDQIIFANDAFRQILPMQQEEIIGKGMKDIWPGWENNWTETCSRVATTGVLEKIEIQLAPGGQRFTCNIYRPNDNGQRICLVFEQITQ